LTWQIPILRPYNTRPFQAVAMDYPAAMVAATLMRLLVGVGVLVEVVALLFAAGMTGALTASSRSLGQSR
jgi:hypothetical protein